MTADTFQASTDEAINSSARILFFKILFIENGTPWATVTRNLKKPLGNTFDFLNVCLFSRRHPLESHMRK